MDRLQQGIEFLAAKGLNLFAVLDLERLPKTIITSLENMKIPLPVYARLVLLGSGGKRLWAVLGDDDLQRADPIDEFSLATADIFIHDYLKPAPYQVLYPGDYPLPLQQLGTLAGWHTPSPLGIGINAEFGLWFAYRVAFLSALELPVSIIDTRASPCLSCADKPCIATCPARAASADAAFSIPACTAFRLQSESACAEQCLARLACPVGAEHRYHEAQVRYHYRRSLRSIKAFTESNQ